LRKWERIFEDLQPLGRKLRCNLADAGHGAAGVSQAVDQARRNRVGACDGSHRNIRTDFDDPSRGVALRYYQICRALQVINELRQSLWVCFSCPPLVKQRTAHNIAALGKPGGKPDDDFACVCERRQNLVVPHGEA